MLARAMSVSHSSMRGRAPMVSKSARASRSVPSAAGLANREETAALPQEGVRVLETGSEALPALRRIGELVGGRSVLTIGLGEERLSSSRASAPGSAGWARLGERALAQSAGFRS